METTEFWETTGEELAAEADSSLPEGAQPQWVGDVGTLSMNVRRLLVKLISGPYISAKDHRNLWVTLLEHQEIVRSRLNDLCLELRFDEDLGVAFARNAEVEIETPKLMRSKPLTHLQTMLLVYARQIQLKASATGLTPFITKTEIIDIMRPYVEHVEKRDDSQLNKRANAAIQALIDQSILIKTSEEDRYQIGGIVAFVVDVTTAEAIARQYKEIIDRERSNSKETGEPGVAEGTYQ